MKVTGMKCHTGTARSHKKLSCHVLIFFGGILATSSLHVKVSIFFFFFFGGVVHHLYCFGEISM